MISMWMRGSVAHYMQFAAIFLYAASRFLNVIFHKIEIGGITKMLSLL